MLACSGLDRLRHVTDLPRLVDDAVVGASLAEEKLEEDAVRHESIAVALEPVVPPGYNLALSWQTERLSMLSRVDLVH